MIKSVLKRALVFSLTLALLISILPGTVITAFAAVSGSLDDSRIGLSSDGGTWTVQGAEINGVMTASCNKTGTSTLTLTNNSGGKVHLSFQYSITSNSQSVTIDGATKTSEGTFEKDLDASGSVVIKLNAKGGSYTEGETSINITNISLIALDAKANITFTQPMNGTVTVDKVPLNATKVFNDKTAAEGYSVEAKPTDGYRFFGWIVDGKLFSRELSATLKFDKDTTVEAKFIGTNEPVFDVGGQFFYDCDAAILAAQAGDAKTVSLLVDWTAENGFTVPMGITFLIPCMENDAGYTNGFSPDGTTTKGNTGPNGTLYRTLTVPKDAVVSVSGTLLVNAVTGRNAAGHYDQDVNGGFGEVQLEGRIEVNEGGLLDVNGYVKGNGSIDVASGGKVYDLYVVINWRGGSAASGAVMAGHVYPMNEFKMHNIEVPILLQHDSTLSGTVKMFADGGYQRTRFPQIDNSNGLFRFTSGSVSKTYIDGREKLVFDGDGGLYSSSITVPVAGALSTSNYIYPFDGDMDFSFSGNWTFNERIKFMPGATVTLENEASLTVPEKTTSAPNTDNLVVFYDNTFQDATIAGTRYPSDRANAVLIMKGGSTLTALGAFGGKIAIDRNVTENSPASVTVNGAVSVTTQEMLTAGAMSGTTQDITSAANIDGYVLPSSNTYTCWKEDNITMIKVGADGEEVKNVTYSGAAQAWDADGSYEYKAEGGQWSKDAPTDAGTYSVRKVTETGDGYKVIEVLGTLTVEPMVAEFELNDSTFTYQKDTAHTVSAKVSNAKNRDSDLGVTLSGNVTETDAGEYTVTVSEITGTGAKNYKIEGSKTASLSWKIEQAEAPSITFPKVEGSVTYKPDGKLEDVKLSFEKNEYGTFAWTQPGTVPTVKVTQYEVTFTPSPETIKNYKDISPKTQMVTVIVQKGEQAAPVGVTAHDEQTIPGNDGYITGVTTDMEYQKESDGETWTSVTGDTITGLKAGSYNVRYKANDNQNAGTPTKVTVNKYNPTAEAQPTASIDYEAEELTGLAAGNYKINGTTDVTVDETGKIKIHEDWIGQTISIVKKGDGTHTVDSNALMLDIPARPDAPTDLKGGYTSKPDAADGKVTGLDGTAAYEYSTDGTAWNKLTGETKLAKGTYQVRLAATDKAFHSETAQVEVKDPTVEVVPEISIDYGAEKLTGFESGTYTVNGTQITVTDNKADINPDWFGTTVKIVKKGTYPTSIDSAEKKLAIPARPAAPSVTMKRISEAGQSDGGITVQNPAQDMTYEYRKGTDGQWTDMVNAAADGLSEDTYYVRVKAGADHFAGNIAEVKVTHKEAQAKPQLEVKKPAAIGEKGSVKGLTTAMEWSKEQNGTYTRFTQEKIAELEAIEGNLHLWVRMAETETLAHSEAVEITVTAFVPEVMETPTNIAIDYAKEQLTGLTEGSYRITVDGEDTTVTVTGTVCDIQDGWFGKEIELVKAGDQIVSVDGETVTVTVPARPDAPEGLDGKTPTSSVGTDGSITGLDSETVYQYKAADDEWQDVEAGKEIIEGLAVGFYDVRIKATEEAFASESARVEVKEYVAPPIPVIPPDTTETVTNPDGSTTTTTTEADGTKTETTTQTDGTVTEKVTEPDGSAVETTTTPEGVTGQVTTDAQGEITAAEVVIPEAKDDEVVTAPVEVPAAKSAEEAPEISVKTGSEDTTKVEIPVTEVGPGTVAVVVHEDGTEEVVRDCVISENGVVLNVEGDVTLKIVDNTQTFKDVEPVDHWATDEVEFVAARELFNGKEENMFDPDGDMTRGMLVTVLHRLAYEPDAVKTSFGDVNANEYYAEAVSWAAGLGVVNGKGENSFAPEEDITREDLAVILYRYAEKMGYDLTQNGTYSSFADAGDISDYARKAMDWAVSVGLIAGKENGRLAPQENATRAQVAAIFMRFCKNVIK